MNKGLILKVLGLCLVSALIASFAVYAFTPDEIQTFSGGIYSGASSYTIYEIDGTYYSKDGNGYIFDSGTDAYTVIQNTFDDCIDGDEVYIKNGQYPIDETLVIDCAMSLKGECMGIGTLADSGTVLVQPEGVVLDPVLQLTYSGMQIEDIYIWSEDYGETYAAIGASATYTGTALEITKSNGWITTIRNFQERGFSTGVRLQSDDGPIDHVMFYDCDFGPNDLYGLAINRTDYYIADLSFVNVRLDTTDKKCDYQIWIDSQVEGVVVALLKFYGTTVAAADTYGIYMNNTWWCKFYDLHFDGTFTQHIQVDNIAYRNQFSGLTCSMSYPIIVDNGYLNAYDGPYDHFLSRGTASVTGAINEVAVAHSIATGTPTYVLVTPRQIESGDFAVTSRNATHIVIEFENQPGGDTWYFDWRCDYIP